MPTPNPPMLLCYQSPPTHYRPTMFSTNEVFCGPDCESREENGRVVSIRTPPGQWSVTDLINTLPPSQKPEIIVVKTDGTGRNIPRHLGAAPGRKVLVLGDTHHLPRPIASILDYAQQEPFDTILTDCNRQHLHFFRRAGFPSLHWIPHLTWRPNALPPKADPRRSVVFIGQAGRHHPYRNWLLRTVRKRGLPLETLTLPQDDCAAAYNAAAVSLNCCLNGDLNLRIFEVLGAGGLLLTDRLSPESGLAELLIEDEDYVGYTSIDELLEKAAYCLDNAAKTRDICRSGQAKVLGAYGAEAMRARFFTLLDTGTVAPPMIPEPRALHAVPIDRDRLHRRVTLYEAAQALNKASGVLRLFLYPGTEDLAEDCADLLRLQRHPVEDLPGPMTEAPLLAAAAPGAAAMPAHHVLALAPAVMADGRLQSLLRVFHGHTVMGAGHGWSVAMLAELTHALDAWGFTADASGLVFSRTQPLRAVAKAGLDGCPDLAVSFLAALHREGVAPPAQLAPWAQALGDRRLEATLLTAALGRNRHDRACLLALGRLAEEGWYGAGDGVAAMTAAAQLAPLAPDEERRLQALTQRTIPSSAAPKAQGKAPAPLHLLTAALDRRYDPLLDELRRRGHEVAAASPRKGAPAPSAVLLGLPDAQTTPLLSRWLEGGTPVLHLTASAAPVTLPQHPGLVTLPGSRWLAERLGTGPAVLYPGVAVERFRFAFPPAFDTLRLACFVPGPLADSALVLINALAQLHHTDVAFDCVLVCDPSDAAVADRLREHTTRLGFAGRLHCVGTLNAGGRAELYAGRNALLHLGSEADAFPTEVVEAMAAGLPVLAADLGVSREIVGDGGVLFDAAAAPASLVEAANALYYDRPRWAAAAAAAHAQALGFSAARAADQVEALTAVTVPA